MEDLEKENSMIQIYLITGQQILIFCKRSTLFSLRENGTKRLPPYSDTEYYTWSINKAICDQSQSLHIAADS